MSAKQQQPNSSKIIEKSSMINLESELLNDNGTSMGTLKLAVKNALGQTQSANFEELVKKNSILEKIKQNNSNFTSDEIVLIKEACLKVFPDVVTIAVINKIAPNDLK